MDKDTQAARIKVLRRHPDGREWIVKMTSEDHIQSAPPLTPEDRDRIRDLLFRGSSGDDG